MNHEFKKPADAQAKNELTALITNPCAPVALAVRAASIFLIARLIVIDEAQAAT